MDLSYRLRLNRRSFRFILIAMVWTNDILVHYLRVMLTRLPLLGEYSQQLVTVIYIIVAVIALPQLGIKVRDAMVYVIAALIYVLSAIIFPETEAYWDANAGRFLLNVLPMYFVGVSICAFPEDHDRVVQMLYRLSMLAVAARLISYCFAGDAMTQVESLYEGDMDGAYKLVPHICLIMYYAMARRNLLNTAMFLLGSVFLVFLGTRGAVFVEVVCFVLMALFTANWKYKYLKIAVIGILGLAFVLSPLFETFVLWMYTLAEEAGLSVRIFDKIISGELGELSGRGRIADAIYDAMNERAYGYGIYGDRAVVGTYAHNIYLEMWMHYGVIFGTLLCLTVLAAPVAAFFLCRSRGIRGFIIVLYSTGIVKLFMSGSYLDEKLLFMLMGMSLSIIASAVKER